MAALIENAGALRKHAAAALAAAVRSRGVAAGVAAVLLDDDASITAILEGEDRSARLGALASARLARRALPLDVVARLLGSREELERRAADSYLDADDRPAARRLLLERQPDRARILGAALDRRFEEDENRLRREVLGENGPEKIHALLFTGTWGPWGSVVVRIARNGVTVETRNGGRVEQRSPRPGEWEETRRWLEERGVDDLAPLRLRVYDGIQYQYLRIDRDGGRRLFMNNPGCGAPWDWKYQCLVERFRTLGGLSSR